MRGLEGLNFEVWDSLKCLLFFLIKAHPYMTAAGPEGASRKQTTKAQDLQFFVVTLPILYTQHPPSFIYLAALVIEERLNKLDLI